MIFPLLQIAAIAAVAVCLDRWRAGVRRRNTQSWESLLARLRPDWSARGLSDHFLLDERSNTTPEEKWRCLQGANGLWAIHENARVMLEMADYAARNSDSVDRQFLETLRSDAMKIRISVIKALAQYAFSQVNESICGHAFRAASMYTGMTARMTELLQVSAAGILPEFLAAAC